MPPPSVAHAPFVQVCVQHSAAALQAAPTSRHVVAEHAPFTHEFKQHSVLAEHESPAALQNVLVVQTEPLQAPQHGLEALHGWPAAMQTPLSASPGGTPPHWHAVSEAAKTAIVSVRIWA